MKPSVAILLASSLLLTAAGLTACGKKDADSGTNIVELNSSDGTMNDMTVVESATLDQASAAAAAAENGAADAADTGNASNAM